MKNLSVAICLFGLSFATQAEAQDKFQSRIIHHSKSQLLAVAEMAPDTRRQPATQKTNNDAIATQDQVIQARPISASEQAQLKNYAPFMRNIVLSSSQANATQHIKAARISRAGKQVIVLGGP